MTNMKKRTRTEEEETHGSATTRRKYHFFSGKDSSSPFSQRHRCHYTLNGFEYSTAAQGVAHTRALLFGQPDIARDILKATSPDEIDLLERKIKGEWKLAQWSIIYQNVAAKFSQNQDLLELLVKTTGALVDESEHKDSRSASYAQKNLAQKQWDRTNILGKVLTQVREDFVVRQYFLGKRQKREDMSERED
mmetsp:Transcript_18278/g.27620  ORF Transcript_18278/g.27620 Transcript_18278/m.27620 type:complete len:192 (-) Transcript_18278:145-720(-)